MNNPISIIMTQIPKINKVEVKLITPDPIELPLPPVKWLKHNN